MRRADVLEAVKWGMDNFGSVVTNAVLPLRDVRRAEKAGLVKCVGLVELCDDDGFAIANRRVRPGWVLTDAGLKLVESTATTGGAESKEDGK